MALSQWKESRHLMTYRFKAMKANPVSPARRWLEDRENMSDLELTMLITADEDAASESSLGRCKFVQAAP